MRGSSGLCERYEAFGRMSKGAVGVLRQGVASLEGEPVDLRTGEVLNDEEAYETVYLPINQEPLGTVSRLENLATVL